VFRLKSDAILKAQGNPTANMSILTAEYNLARQELLEEIINAKQLINASIETIADIETKAKTKSGFNKDNQDNLNKAKSEAANAFDNLTKFELAHKRILDAAKSALVIRPASPSSGGASPSVALPSAFGLGGTTGTISTRKQSGGSKKKAKANAKANAKAKAKKTRKGKSRK